MGAPPAVTEDRLVKPQAGGVKFSNRIVLIIVIPSAARLHLSRGRRARAKVPDRGNDVLAQRAAWSRDRPLRKNSRRNRGRVSGAEEKLGQSHRSPYGPDTPSALSGIEADRPERARSSHSAHRGIRRAALIVVRRGPGPRRALGPIEQMSQVASSIRAAKYDARRRCCGRFVDNSAKSVDNSCINRK